MVDFGVVTRVDKHTGPTTGTPHLIAAHVRQGGVEGGHKIDLGMEGCGDDAQRTTLAAARHAYVLAVPLRKGHQVVDGLYATHIDTAVVVVVALLDVGVPILSDALLGGLNLLLRGVNRQAVNLHREGDETLLGIACRGVDVLHTCSGRNEQYGVLGTIVGDGYIAVNRVALLVAGDADHRGGEAVVGKLRVGDGGHFDGGGHGTGLFDALLPEEGEIERVIDGRLDVVHIETHLDGLRVALALYLETDGAEAETRRSHRADGHKGLAVTKNGCSLQIGLHTVVARLVADHHPVESRTTRLGIELETRLLPDFIEAVRMVGQDRKIDIGGTGLHLRRGYGNTTEHCHQQKQSFHSL